MNPIEGDLYGYWAGSSTWIFQQPDSNGAVCADKRGGGDDDGVVRTAMAGRRGKETRERNSRLSVLDVVDGRISRSQREEEDEEDALSLGP